MDGPGHQDCPFERYADDIVAHCDTEEQAQHLRASMAERLESLGLELHPEKTKVVFCKDANRPGRSEHVSFDFLGYTFRARLAKGPYGYFAGFSPAISAAAKKAKGLQVRTWHLSRRTWGGTCPASPRRSTLWCGAGSTTTEPSTAPSCASSCGVSTSIWTRWATHKFKRFRKRYLRAMEWLQRICRRDPKLFAHWQLVAFANGRTVGAG